MKTHAMMFILLLAAFAMQASNNPGTELEKAKSLTIETHTWKSENVHIQIRQADGEIVLDETVRTGNLRKYNLKHLPAGQYVLEMSDSYRVTEQTFTIGQLDVQVSAPVKTTFKPVIARKGNALDVNLMTQGEEAFITITDQASETLFAEKCAKTSLHRRYDISRLPAGSYALSIEVGDRTYTERFSKR